MAAEATGSVAPFRGDDRSRTVRALPLLPFLATGFAGGLALSHVRDSPHPDLWLALSCAFLLLGAVAFRLAPFWLTVLALCLAAACFGAGWSDVRQHALAPNDLAAWIDDETRLIRVEGIAKASPTVRDYTGGSLGRFDWRPPASAFPLHVQALWTVEGERIPVTGNLLVRVGETIAPFRPGDSVRTIGHLTPFNPPHNPGDFDAPTLAHALNQAGLLRVSSRELVDVTPADRPRVIERWIGWRETLHRRAAGWLLAHLPDTGSTHREDLLKALVLGQREPTLDGLHESFRRTGLAHLLAISGLHLGIVAGMVLLLLRATPLNPRWHAWMVFALVVVFLVLVEVRMPILRAGVMTIAVCFGLALGRRFNIGSLVALSAILLLLWRPDQLFNAGFQLSYGVVLGLIYLSPIVRSRWLPGSSREPTTTMEYLGDWLLAAAAVTVTSWLIATPIVMYHFGFVAPLGIPMSVPAVPLVALLLATGYLKIILELVLPSVAVLLAAPLAIFADVLIAIVLAIDAIPGTVWYVPFPTAAWTFAALASVTSFVLIRGKIAMRIAPLVLAVLLVWLYWPRLPIHDPPALRVDMLSVGHGTCLVLRSGNETFIFDAGSITRFDIGDRTLVPSLRRLGVTSIDAIVISHPHVDHYSAVIELVDAFNVDRVLTTHQFIERARSQPYGPVAYVMNGLTDRYTIVEPVVKGETMRMGEATLTWLHPPFDLDRFRRDNEHSMVIRVDVAGRRVVLTGDVEREGLAHLVSRKPDLRACVVEIPHHGSYNDLAAAFITQLEPEIVLQSSGHTQWRRDRWADLFEENGITRLVTARDGASAVLIDQNGNIKIERFIEYQRD